jgi:gluconokinase
MHEPYIIGIDIGTGSTKAVSIDLKGNILHVAQSSYPTIQPEPGYSEQDPERIWAAFKECVSKTTGHIGYEPVALSLSSAMHSIIPVNELGRALMNMITWADARSEAIAEGLKASEQGEQIYRTSGTPLHAMAPLSKILWIKQNKPSLYTETFKFISIKEFIWFKLFATFEIDYSIASATGMFDIIKLCWSETIIDTVGLNISQLSEPVNTSFLRDQIQEDVAIEMDLPKDTKVIIGASDGCCANLGSAVIDARKAALTIGTSGAVRVTSDKPVYDFRAMTFNYLLDEKTYICGGPVNNGGLAIDWAIKKFLNNPASTGDTYNIFFSIIQQQPFAAEKLLFLPYLTGERAPYWDTAASAAFIGVRPHHNIADFLRAVLEGVCFALNQVLVTVEQSVGNIEQLHVSGGFIHSPLWLQVLSDLTGKKLLLVQTEDASAIGAAILASRALFADNSLESAVLSRENEYILPDMNKHAHYKKLMPVFRKLYADLKDSMQLLNQINN